MKKVVLGMMLIVGSLSFANDRENREEKSFEKWREANFFQQEQSVDEYISRSSQKVVKEDLSEFVLLNERGSDRN